MRMYMRVWVIVLVLLALIFAILIQCAPSLKEGLLVPISSGQTYAPVKVSETYQPIAIVVIVIVCSIIIGIVSYFALKKRNERMSNVIYENLKPLPRSNNVRRNPVIAI